MQQIQLRKNHNTIIALICFTICFRKSTLTYKGNCYNIRTAYNLHLWSRLHIIIHALLNYEKTIRQAIKYLWKMTIINRRGGRLNSLQYVLSNHHITLPVIQYFIHKGTPRASSASKTNAFRAAMYESLFVSAGVSGKRHLAEVSAAHKGNNRSQWQKHLRMWVNITLNMLYRICNMTPDIQVNV